MLFLVMLSFTIHDLDNSFVNFFFNFSHSPRNINETSEKSAIFDDTSSFLMIKRLQINGLRR